MTKAVTLSLLSLLAVTLVANSLVVFGKRPNESIPDAFIREELIKSPASISARKPQAATASSAKQVVNKIAVKRRKKHRVSLQKTATTTSRPLSAVLTYPSRMAVNRASFGKPLLRNASALHFTSKSGIRT